MQTNRPFRVPGQGGSPSAGPQTVEIWHFNAIHVNNPQDVDWSQNTEPSGFFLRREPAVRIELFFGLGRGDGLLTTSEIVWDRFVREEVARCFPGGFTVLTGVGGGQSGLEPARIVVALVPDYRSVQDGSLSRLAGTWCRLAEQHEVLAVFTPNCPLTSAIGQQLLTPQAEQDVQEPTRVPRADEMIKCQGVPEITEAR
jgi:hypothetical protein